MFNTLASYLLGTPNQANEVEETKIRLTSVTSDDDWVLVDRDSEGNSDVDSDSSEGLVEHEDLDNIYSKLPQQLTRSSSTASLPCITMEESWFVTPPPCFTSAGPIHMETSPLENLLIEHPSMSVYQHTHPALIAHRYSIPIEYISSSDLSYDSEEYEEEYEYEVRQVEAEVERLRGRQIRVSQRNRIDLVCQEEKQWFRTKQAQKVQLQKSYKLLTRKYLENANKAREIPHNRHQRRSNHYHGTKRSYVNNNRKC